MFKLITFMSGFFILSIVSAATPAPDRYFVDLPTAKYTVEFNGAPAGSVVIERLAPGTQDGKDSFHVRAVARTEYGFRKLVPWTQTIDSYIDRATLLPVRVDVEIEQRDKIQKTKITLDSESRKGTELEESSEPGQKPAKRTKGWKIPKGAQSIFTILDYVRTRPLTPGSRLSFPVSHDERNGTFEALVEKAETITIAGKRHQAIRLKVQKSFTRAFWTGLKTQPTFWLSANGHHELLKLELAHQFGRVIAQLDGEN